MDHSRRQFVKTAASAAAAFPVQAAPKAPSQNHRQYWISTVERLANPVLGAASQRRLKADMPVEAPHGNLADRRKYSHLEALGRLLAGLAPWLEKGPENGNEGALRSRAVNLARTAIGAAVDPASPDYLNFHEGAQPVVDAAFLALALLRAPGELWKKLSPETQKQVVTAMQSTRVIRPGFNNWLLFSATVEAFLAQAGETWDAMRIDYAVRQHEEWYKGDGLYGDGPQLHWDYYNSFVIHPMLLQVIETISAHSNAWSSLQPRIKARAQRYAAIQERLIAPDGTYPAIGRSITYRCGAFHLLADMALRRELPAGLAPEQVRCALTAVIRKTLDAPETFDSQGWLKIGLCGHQPSLGEPYISTGSLYLCSAAFLPLGLPEADEFWKNPAQSWTSQKVWTGQNLAADHALRDSE